MKRKLSFVAVLLMALSIPAAQAQTFDFYSAAPNGQALWYKINADGVSVSLVSPLGEWPCYPNNDSKPAGNLVIPDTVYHGGNAYAVTAMAMEALRECTGITALHIPATMTVGVADYNLLGLSGLMQITVDPDNPVFDSRNNCNAIINTETNHLVLGSGSTVIPADVVAIDQHAFFGNTTMTSITIPPSVNLIDYRAFCDCSLNSVTFQGGTGTYLDISYQAFMNCNDLTSLNIPSHVLAIGPNAFCRCFNLTSITVDPENPVYDSRDNCNAIIVSNTNVLKVGCVNTVIPTTVTKIGIGASIGDHNETDAHIVIPDWVTGFASDNGLWIDENSNPFAAQSIADITFPAGWQNFEPGLRIWYHGSWSKLIFLGSTPPALNIEGQAATMESLESDWHFTSELPIVVPCGALATWQADPVWSYFTNMSEPGVPQLAVSAAEHGSAAVVTLPTCGNNTAVVSATADEHYHFHHWSDGSTDNPYTLVMIGDSALTAYFAIDSVTVTAATSNAAMGSALGGGTVPLGGTATVTATPSGSYIFLCWNNGVTDNPYTLTATQDTVLTAMFTVQDTLVLHDTIYVDVPYPVHDTTYIDVHDTTYIDVPYAVHDTTVVTDTLTVTEYVQVHDTTYLTEYEYVHDTTYITLTDTVTNTLYDTITNTVFDTVINTIYDTTVVYSIDTLWLYDTVFLHDTIVIYDTVYVGVDDVETINARIYTSGGQVVIEGAEGNTVWLYDVNGRVLATKQDDYSPLHFDVPASGAYLVKIGNHAARKVVVIR